VRHRERSAPVYKIPGMMLASHEINANTAQRSVLSERWKRQRCSDPAVAYTAMQVPRTLCDSSMMPVCALHHERATQSASMWSGLHRHQVCLSRALSSEDVLWSRCSVCSAWRQGERRDAAGGHPARPCSAASTAPSAAAAGAAAPFLLLLSCPCPLPDARTGNLIGCRCTYAGWLYQVRP